MHQGAPFQCSRVFSTRFAISKKFKFGQGRPWIEALLLNHVAWNLGERIVRIAFSWQAFIFIRLGRSRLTILSQLQGVKRNRACGPKHNLIPQVFNFFFAQRCPPGQADVSARMHQLGQVRNWPSTYSPGCAWL